MTFLKTSANILSSLQKALEKKYRPRYFNRKSFVALFDRFDELFNSFAMLHRNVAGFKLLPDAKKACRRFVANYKTAIPYANVSLKIHVIEQHMFPFLSRHNKGCAWFSVSAIETLHAQFNRASRRAAHIRNPGARQMNVVNSFTVRTSIASRKRPAQTQPTSPYKRRKLNEIA